MEPYSSNHSQRLNRDGGGNLRGRKNNDARNERLQQAPQVESNRAIANQYSRTERDAVTNNAVEAIQDVAKRCGGATGGTGGRGFRIKLALEFLLDGRIEGKDFQVAFVDEWRVEVRRRQGVAGRLNTPGAVD